MAHSRCAEWQLVLFSDESRFLVKPRDGRIRVWRCPGEQLADDAVQEVTAFGGGSVMQIGAQAVFMDDDATPHRCRTVNTFVVQAGITRMPWPANSPDLNPIEKSWGRQGTEVTSLQRARGQNGDAYLERFERFAASNNWGQETWAVKLSALLTGKALDFYARLPRGDAEDYNKLKGELLKHYDFTEEGYRRRFRNCKPEDGETPSLFVERLSSYLQKWIQLAGLHEEYADLRDLIIKEQMLNACSKKVAARLREQRDQSLNTMTESAQRYLDAHNLNTDAVAKEIKLRNTKDTFAFVDNQSVDGQKMENLPEMIEMFLAINKTLDRIQGVFYWPDMGGDVTRFCRSCDVCQKTVSKGKAPKVLLQKMPLIDVPFKRVAVDLVGPISPPSEDGAVEAVPLKKIDAPTVAEALVDMFSRLGIPEEILSDRGTQFISDCMEEVN
nr:hypothetical protein BaRGS_027819 [Batillaria attramentaria]